MPVDPIVSLEAFVARYLNRLPRVSNRERWYGIDPSAYPIPFCRMRFRCVRCGYGLLRAGEAKEATSYPWSNRSAWRGNKPFYKECKNDRDCDRRIRHNVAGRKRGTPMQSGDAPEGGGRDPRRGPTGPV